jgi:hypothetical protein
MGTANAVCAITDLAALLAHETSHTCLRREKFAYLLGQFMRVKLSSLSPIPSAATLCCWSNLTSYDAKDWTSCKAVVSSTAVRLLGVNSAGVLACGRAPKCP